MMLGCSLGSLLTVRQVLDSAKTLARYKVHSVWIPETWGMESVAMLSAVSGVMPHLVGSSIINAYSRTPSLIAMGAATLDAISQGRLILGLGSSSMPIVEDLHGKRFDNPLTRMEECIDVIRMAVAGQKIRYNGRHFKLKGFRLLIKPHRNRIPIYLAAVNQKMVELAWRKADGVLFYLRPMTEMKKTIDMMQKKRKIVVCSQIITAVSPDSEKARARARTTLAFYVSVGEIYRKFLAENGFARETACTLNEYKRAGLPAAANAIPDTMLDTLAVSGTPIECRKKMAEFADAGLDVPIIQFNPVDSVSESMKLTAETFFEKL